ncbi:MAG: AAA family ATPase [Candidatus Binatia bacterium]
MKLLRLYLGDYRVLRDLRIDFGPPSSNGDALQRSSSYALDFLVGVNGTGKSTVLRAIVDLIQELEGNPVISFPFEMEYELGANNDKRTVKISNRADETSEGTIPSVGPLQVWVNSDLTQWSNDFLPTRVVAFTTGSEAEWEQPRDADTLTPGTPDDIRNLTELEQALRELPGRPARVETDDSHPLQSSRFLLIKAQQLPLVTLCGLLTDFAAEEDPEDRRLHQALKEAKVGTLRGFSLKFRMNQGVTSPTDREEVDRLAQRATRALRFGADHLLIFDLTEREHTVAQQILTEFSDGLRLFETLARLATPVADQQPILREINLFLERPLVSRRPGEKREQPPLHLLEWLSDGEQSFLGRLCLFSLLGETEALILLDEPEVHFNDYWKRQIVHLLDHALTGRHSHVLISTHSSITLTDVPREDIVVLDRSVNYTSSAFHPRIQTFAADPSDIMVHVFGAPQASGAQSVARIQEVLEVTPSRVPEERTDQLRRLLGQVSPGYWSYRIRRELLGIERQ